MDHFEAQCREANRPMGQCGELSSLLLRASGNRNQNMPSSAAQAEEDKNEYDEGEEEEGEPYSQISRIQYV
jgi:hypothetical protein